MLGEEPAPTEVRLACRTGHVLTLEALDSAQDIAIEDALWAAVRALEEKAAFSRRLFERAQRQHDERSAERHSRQSRASERRAIVVRELLRAPEMADPPDAG